MLKPAILFSNGIYSCDDKDPVAFRNDHVIAHFPFGQELSSSAPSWVKKGHFQSGL